MRKELQRLGISKCPCWDVAVSTVKAMCRPLTLGGCGLKGGVSA